MPHHAFHDIDRIVDDVHALFDTWAEDGTLDGVLSEEGAFVFRLAVHEWIANLVQHAAFPGPFEVAVDVEVDDKAVRCTIEDTSCGFDFASQVEQQQTLLDAPAPSERGRGLLMLITCTTRLGFEPASRSDRQRISFAIENPPLHLFAPLFRPADLADDAFGDDAFGDDAFGDDAFGDDPLVHGDGALGTLSDLPPDAPSR